MRVLGLDWVVVLTGPQLHASTVLVALRMLVALLSNANILHKFRDASGNGGWLNNLQQVAANRQGLVLGESVYVITGYCFTLLFYHHVHANYLVNFGRKNNDIFFFYWNC